MQSDTYVDISFTVLERVRQGRRLLRDLKTGQTYWEPAEPTPDAPVEQPSAVSAPTLTKSVAKRVKAQAKRLLHG